MPVLAQPASSRKLQDEPELANADPEGDGWFLTISVQNPEEIEALMDENAYNELLMSL